MDELIKKRPFPRPFCVTLISIIQGNEIMANFKNKAYSSTTRTRSGQDHSAHYYHKSQEAKQDKLIQQWLETKQTGLRLAAK